jgi:hypothetical protein
MDFGIFEDGTNVPGYWRNRIRNLTLDWWSDSSDRVPA